MTRTGAIRRTKNPRKKPEPKKTPRQRLQADETITAAALRELMRDKVLNSRLIMPADDALEKLASILEYWRQYFVIDQTVWPAKQEAHEALARLVPALEQLEKIHAEWAVNAANAGASAAMKILSCKREAISAAMTAISSLYVTNCVAEHVESALGWQWLAGALPVDFEAAMQSTNLNFKCGIGHTGPLARFITAVVTPVTGHHTTPESVATILKKRRRDREK